MEKGLLWGFYLISFLFLWQCLVLKAGETEERPFVFDEIYDGEHFRDLLFSPTSGLAIRHAVLILYNPDCGPQVEKWRILHDKFRLPDDSYVQFSVHDYELAKNYTWYNADASLILTSWFNISTECLKVVFLPRGSTKHVAPIILENPENFLNWIWDQVMIKVTLVNSANEDIHFSFHGNYEKISEVIVGPGQETSVEAYTSYILTTTGKSGFYGGCILGYTDRNFTITMATLDITESEYIDVWKEKIDKRRGILGKNVWDYADRNLLNRKQPLFVHNFTMNGHLKLKMPDWVRNQLQNYYEENKDFREPEYWVTGMTAINMESQRCGMVELDTATRGIVAAGIQPLLEEWCNCKLILSYFYGIREYYNGHRLKSHVDRINTHIISVILQIAQDLDGGPDWKLEVITFNGERKYLTLKAGEMLFYESARLIHGRPDIFQGRVMANAFLHFRPVDWLYERQRNGQIYYDGERLAKVYPLDDPKTLSAVQDRLRSSSGAVNQVKDEL